MSQHRRSRKSNALFLLFLAAAVFGVDGICLNCLPNNLTEEEIERVLAEDFKERLMDKLGLSEEPVVPENVTRPPQEVIDEIFSEQNNVVPKKDDGVLQTIVIQPLNNDSAVSNTTSYFEYVPNMDRRNRIEHVTLWVHVESNTGVYKVYEKISTLPRRMVIMDVHNNDVSIWKKINFVPNRQWLEDPWGKKIRVEIEGMETRIANKALLQLKVKLVKKRLRKRSAVSTTMHPMQRAATDDCHTKHWNRCCKRDRVIPMQNYYPWVIVPTTFRSFSCWGTCDISYRNNVTWTLFSQLTAPSRHPCCVPTSFNDMTLLIYDNAASFTSRVIKDLLVAECGCL